ncbi:hypothetical protein D3C75_983930 [compost metagenome]
MAQYESQLCSVVPVPRWCGQTGCRQADRLCTAVVLAAHTAVGRQQLKALQMTGGDGRVDLGCQRRRIGDGLAKVVDLICRYIGFSCKFGQQAFRIR